MVVTVVGAHYGSFEGTPYGRIHSFEKIEANGTGVKPVSYKTSSIVAQSITEVDCEYNLEFNQYGKVINVMKV